MEFEYKGRWNAKRSDTQCTGKALIDQGQRAIAFVSSARSFVLATLDLDEIFDDIGPRCVELRASLAFSGATASAGPGGRSESRLTSPTMLGTPLVDKCQPDRQCRRGSGTTDGGHVRDRRRGGDCRLTIGHITALAGFREVSYSETLRRRAENVRQII
jgi:hypothetical protein